MSFNKKAQSPICRPGINDADSSGKNGTAMPLATDFDGKNSFEPFVVRPENVSKDEYIEQGRPMAVYLSREDNKGRNELLTPSDQNAQRGSEDNQRKPSSQTKIQQTTPKSRLKAKSKPARQEEEERNLSNLETPKLPQDAKQISPATTVPLQQRSPSSQRKEGKLPKSFNVKQQTSPKGSEIKKEKSPVSSRVQERKSPKSSENEPPKKASPIAKPEEEEVEDVPEEKFTSAYDSTKLQSYEESKLKRTQSSVSSSASSTSMMRQVNQISGSDEYYYSLMASITRTDDIHLRLDGYREGWQCLMCGFSITKEELWTNKTRCHICIKQ